MDLNSFGLTSTYRVNIFTQIHEIVFHGKGGYDWHTIYNMPIWLRNFTFNKIKQFYDNEKETIQNDTPKVPEALKNGKISPPNFKPNPTPTYTAKTSKK